MPERVKLVRPKRFAASVPGLDFCQISHRVSLTAHPNVTYHTILSYEQPTRFSNGNNSDAFHGATQGDVVLADSSWSTSTRSAIWCLRVHLVFLLHLVIVVCSSPSFFAITVAMAIYGLLRGMSLWCKMPVGSRISRTLTVSSLPCLSRALADILGVAQFLELVLLDSCESLGLLLFEGPRPGL